MASGFGQYLKDTRTELNHVAWPTRTQTVVFTVLVAAISVGVAFYLGIFDFLFTTGLTRAIGATPSASQGNITVTPADIIVATSTAGSATTSASLDLPTNKTK